MRAQEIPSKRDRTFIYLFLGKISRRISLRTFRMDHPKLTKEKLKTLFCEVMELQVRCETFEFCAKNASPEMKHHYEACWKDCHWRLCSQIGKLWYYVCGTEQMNPWERPNV